MAHTAGWLGMILILCANAFIIFRNQLAIELTPTDVILLLVGGAICISIENGKGE